MRIKGLSISSFGKFKNKNVEFKKGLNVVYGKNEAGKSTVQAFIKAMLFGLNAKRSKDLSANERLKYLPVNETNAYGEMYLSYEDTDLILKRKFGATKKEDESIVIDEITGEEVKNILNDEPGKTMLSINAQSFENTLSIKQLGAKVQNGKDDEIMHRITNTFQSAEDSVSYQKAQANLEALKKQITTQRKGGSLDILKLRLHTLLEERHEGLKIAEDNLNNEARLIDLKEHREFLNKELKKAYVSKTYLKKIKLKQEYKEISNYLIKNQELKNKKEQVEDSLSTKEGLITEDFIHSLREEARLYFNLKDILSERGEGLENIDKTLEEKLEELKSYEGFEELPEDIEKNLIKLNLENESLEEKLNVISNTNKEIALIEKKINNYKNEFLSYDKLNLYYEDIKMNFYKYEELLKTIKQKVSIEKLDYNIDSKLKEIESKDIYLKAFLGVTGIALLSTLGLTLTAKLSTFMGTLISVALCVVLGGTFIFKKKHQKLKEAAKLEKSKFVEIDGLKALLKDVEDKFDYYLNELGYKSYEELLAAINIYEKRSKEIDVFNLRVEEKRNNLNMIDTQEIEFKLASNKQVVNKLLNFSRTIDIDEFTEKLKEYTVLEAEVKSLRFERESIASNLKHVNEDIDLKLELINEKLELLKLSNIELDEIFAETDKLLTKLKQREEVETQLKSSEETYKVLLKDRDLESMAEELQDILKETEEFSYESEEEIELEIKEKQRELLDTEKEIKDVENSIKTAYLGTRKLVLIEEDIRNVKTNIATYEKKLRAVEIAIKVLEESFKEVQKSFGPLLNKKVGEVFSTLTAGNYEEVKVSESYDLKVRGSSNNQLLESDYLSSGSIDQIYLSLRIALINLIFEGEEVPIILDEAFVQYDDNRLKKALDLLLELSKHKQVILFTCQNREVEYLRDKREVNVINL